MSDHSQPNRGDAEERRVKVAYNKRAIRAAQRKSYFGFDGQAHLFRVNERHFKTLRLLDRAELNPLQSSKILDVGCGEGNLLRDFLEWGAQIENLCGLELREEAVTAALALNPKLKIEVGSAADLPWDDGTFDLVCQHTVFTSILDSDVRRNVANEMIRVLKPGGSILLYDFLFDNLGNSDVRSVGKKEIHKLFPGFEIHLVKLTLAPPLARRIPAFALSLAYPLLASIPILRTHYLGVFKAPYSG